MTRDRTKGKLGPLLDRLFGKAEEINGGHRCPPYMFRWTLVRFGQGKIYLHKFVRDDWSYDLHDHPKRFFSIGLWGSYNEEFWVAPALVDTNGYIARRRWRAPWFRSFPANHRHRITTPYGNCWTLVIVGAPKREWGFWHEGKFIPWLDYVRGKGGIADKIKACD